MKIISEGLYKKFTVIRNNTGEKVEKFTFTLIPEDDPHAVEALIVYAASVGKDNKILAIQLLSTLKPFLGSDANLLFIHKVASSLLALSGQGAEEIGN